MEEYTKLILKEHLQKCNSKDPTALQTDFKTFIKNYTLGFEFYFEEYLKFRTFNDFFYKST